MLAQLIGLHARARVHGDGRARTPPPAPAGAVKILSLTSATAYSLTGSTGETRVAWTVHRMSAAVVQCVQRSTRTGNFLTGVSPCAAARRVSAPISNERRDC